jgi:hypothetical protein
LISNMAIAISEYGNLLIYDNSYSADFVERTIQDRKLNGLRVWDFWEPLSSLDFLSEFTFLTRLEIACRYDHDYSFLRSLSQLQDLSIEGSTPMKNIVDVSSLINLKSAALQWRKDRFLGLECCTKLTDLCLIEFTDHSLSRIADLHELTRLRIKTSALRTLDGVSHLTELKHLELGNCRSLSSIRQLNGMKNLSTIAVHSCRNIADYQELRQLPGLQIFELIACGTIPFVDFERTLPGVTIRLLERTRVAEEPSGG